MTREIQPRLAAYLIAGAVAALAGVALGRPGLVAVAAPFLLLVLTGVLIDRPPALDVSLEVEPARVVEGERVRAIVRVRAIRPARLRLDVPLPAGLGSAVPIATRLARGETRRFELPLRADRWGGYVVGPAYLVATDALGLFAYAGAGGADATLRVYPRPEPLPEGLVPRTTRQQPGMLVSRSPGQGLELAGVRPLAPGDRARRINRRMTARTGQPHVTERLLERNADIVILLDTFGAVRGGSDGTLEQAVRAADALASHHLARGDRVGVVAFGGVMHWLFPAGGARTRVRIVETLIETEIVFSYAWKDVRVLPRRALPAGALVLAITPLLDERGVGALLDLRARGIDVAAIVIPPFPFVRPATPAADRLWRLEHDTLRLRLEHAGVAVAPWPRGVPLAQAVGEVTRRRRLASSRVSPAA